MRIYELMKREIQNHLKLVTRNKTERTCRSGHTYYKSSDCPVCPICELERRPKDSFLTELSAPARRAMENKGIHSLKHLSDFTEQEILKLHGMGPASIPKLRRLLKEEKLSFKEKKNKPP